MTVIFRINIISIILGWEGLGITSFILIMFYQNKKSLNRRFYTIIINRIGDIIILMGMIYIINKNSWSFTTTIFEPQMIIIIILAVAAFSKRAQIPFSSWLTEAMAAPTPISALVHSSTLVTAGVFIFIRFEEVIKYSEITKVIFMTRLTTLTIARINSLIEWDIKKIVALSTLRQISIIFITISINIFKLAIFHLLVHATFKALIFLCARSIIRYCNTQDIRKINKLSKYMFITKIRINTATLTLCGFPFFSRFYSKEIIIEMIRIKKINFFTLILFYLCITSTLIYSIKIIKYLNQTKKNKTTTPIKETVNQKKRIIILLIPAIIYGNKINWLINVNFKLPIMPEAIKILPAILLTLTAALINNINITNKKINKRHRRIIITYIWFIKNLSIQIKYQVLTTIYKTFKNREKNTFNKIIKTTEKTTKTITKINFKIKQLKTQNTLIIILTIMITII